MPDLFLRLSVPVTIALTLSLMCATLAIFNRIPDKRGYHGNEICLSSKHSPCTPYSFESYIIEESEKFYFKTKRYYDRNDAVNGDQALIGLRASMRHHHEDMRPAVRLVGDSRNSNLTASGNARNGMIPVRSWKEKSFLHSSGGFRRFGVQIRNGRIVVPVAGVYEVYSFIQFNEPCEKGKPVGHATDVIKQSVYKFDICNGEEIELMSCSQSHKMSKNTYTNIYDSYQSSIFELRAGDELSVKVNQPDLMRFPENNFFGASFIAQRLGL